MCAFAPAELARMLPLATVAGRIVITTVRAKSAIAAAKGVAYHGVGDSTAASGG